MEQQELYVQYVENVYQNLTELGNGQMGRTFLAKNLQTGKIVVKKLVSLSTGQVYDRLKDIYHPNLPQIYEVCPTKEYCIIIEEYISGETLESILEERKILSEQEVIKYFTQILEGLKAVHAKGVVHRDLTPSNILISTDFVAKIIDFGIARNSKENKYQDTCVLGTVGYASPEQFGFRQTDGRTDIYALGILLNKMLTGKLPNEQLTENRKLKKIVEKCTQIDPDRRYKATDWILAEIKGCGNENKPWERDVSVLPGFRSNIRWRKITATVGYVLLLLFTMVPFTECGMNLKAWFLDGIAVFAYVWMPFFLLSNFGRWDRRIKPFSRMPKEITVAIRIIVSVVAFYYGVLLENYVRYVLLGLPKAP